jgi:hypothetical protein
MTFSNIRGKDVSPATSGTENATHSIYIGSYDERYMLPAGCSFIIYNDKLDTPVAQGSFVINQFQPRSLQPEYEALSASLIGAAKLGLTKLKVYIPSELAFIQLNDKRHATVGSGTTEDNYHVCQSDYLIIQPLYRRVVTLFRKFGQIKVIRGTGVRNSHVVTLARITYRNHHTQCFPGETDVKFV